MNTNNSGITNVDVLSVGALYVGGKRFRDIIRSLIAEDTLEQGEIVTLRTLLANLNTDGLNQSWIVNNDNRNAVLKTLITAIETKLAKIDTTALTETSILNNDNRNSVLKTRLDTAATDITGLTTRVTTAENDIDSLETRETNLENKTKYITSSKTVQPVGFSSTPAPAYVKIQPFETDRAQRVIDLLVNPDEQSARGYDVPPIGRNTFIRLAGSLEDSLTTPQYNRIDMGTYRLSMEANDISITCNPLGLSLSLGEISVPGSIKIGAKTDDIFIGCEEPNPGGQHTITIGANGLLKSLTKLNGFLNTNGARWLLPKSDKFDIALLIALIPTAGSVPLWLFSFALGSLLPSFEYSDVFVMKDGPTAVNKLGDLTTSNDVKLKSLVVFNKDLNYLKSFPIEGTFVARGTISKTTLDGSIRNSVFLDGGGDNKIAFKHHNIAASDITEWATSEANNKINVIEIGGNSGILIHQGASNEGEPLRIIHSKKGSILLALDNDGTMAGSYPGLEVKPYDFGTSVIESMVRIGFNPLSVGNTLNQKVFGSYALEVNHPGYRDGMVVAKAVSGAQGTFQTWLNVINGDSINTPGTITGITLAGNSLVINGNYTGDTTNRLYKNADNKLMWNGSEVGAGGASSGGITYMINVPSNLTNPNPTPTETIMTAAYSGNAQRTITQAITANTAYYIAKYTTEVFDEASNPVLTGLQQLNQYLVWNSNSQTGQIYGRMWFQATAVGLATLYQRIYVSPVTTTAATFINGTPIPTPKGLYNLKFQRVVFPNINVVVTSGPVVLRYRVEGYQPETGWISLTSMVGQVPPSYSSSANNVSPTFDEIKELNQTTSAGAKTALRLVIYIDSGTGTISQTSAGGADLGAYSLIGLGVGTPGLFRTMLYDGTNAKIITPYSTTPTLIEYDMAIDAPYNISAFPLPTLSTELFFIQPAGGFNNHAITLYFNEGSISHFHSSIAPTIATPTLASVLNSGATASQAINMNTNKISGITSLEGSSNGNWEVKEITAGTNISRTITNGNYTITNNAPCQELSAGFGIQLAANTTTKTYTIYNNAAVQNIVSGTGIQVSIDTATKIATITNTATAGGQVARDQLSATNSVGLVPLKLSHYAQNWATINTAVQPTDIFVSQDGKNCVYLPSGTNYIQYSFNYGATWDNSNLTSYNFESICGSITGDILYASKGDGYTGSPPNLIYTSRLYKSLDYGITWSEITLDRTPGAANTWYNRYVGRIRCNSDGSVVIATTYVTTTNTGVANNGTLYISTNGGGTWVVRSLTATSGGVVDCCMSANGAIMFATIEGIFGGSTDNGNGGIYRSFDYGATWTRVRTQIAPGSFFFGIIKCDATGRFLIACDQSVSFPTGGGQIQTSDDFGSNWTWFGDELAKGATAAFVSPGGNLMITAHHTGYNSRIRYSLDYGKAWTNAINFDTIIGAATLRTLASNHDGSLLLIRGSASAIYRSFEERGKLAVDAGPTDLTITPSFGGGYSLYNNPAGEVLWYSGVTTTSSDQSSIYLDDFSSVKGKIDLTQFDIRYEMDILWNLTSVAYPQCWISLGLNQVQASAVANPTQNNAQTTWTNLIQTTFGGMNAYDQVYTSRFFCGFSAFQGTGAAYRYRTTMKGNISLIRRQTEQFSGDVAMNSRLIQNDFETNNCLLEPHSTANQFRIFGSSDADAGQQTQRGVAVWEASYDNLWNLGSSGGNDLNSGVYRLYLRLTNTGTTNIPRGAQIKYSIYRVRK